MRLILIMFLTSACFADKYIIELDNITNKQLSSYNIKDDEVVKESQERTILEVTKEEYDYLSDSKDWDKNTTEWLKTNASKVEIKLTEKQLAIAEEAKIQEKMRSIAIAEIAKEKEIIKEVVIEEPIK